MSTLEGLLQDLASGDEARAEAAIPQLVELDAEVVPALLDLTRSSNVDTRWWALRALASTPHSRAEMLVPFLNDSVPEIRQCAALEGIHERTDFGGRRVMNHRALPFPGAATTGSAVVSLLVLSTIVV